jgi:hypothetical protein
VRRRETRIRGGPRVGGGSRVNPATGRCDPARIVFYCASLAASDSTYPYDFDDARRKRRREVPNPLTAEIRPGEADIEQVMNAVMSLTKLNFNGAEDCDGLPVTLRFVSDGGTDHGTRSAAVQVLHLKETQQGRVPEGVNPLFANAGPRYSRAIGGGIH